MDKTSGIGVFLGFAVLIGGMILKGSSPIALYNPAALVIIIGGTIACILVAFPMDEVKKVPTLFKVVFSDLKTVPVKDMIPMFTEWAMVARKEGLLSLEERSEEVEDAFLKRGLKMVVDGQSQEQIRELMEEEIVAMEERHELGAKIFTQAGTYSPTLGVLGAVIGLVSALGHLDDVALLGKSISAAFIATLFGIFMGYVLWHPFANKLKRKSEQEVRMRMIMLEGLLAVQGGLPARVVEEKLLTYLPSKDRELKEPDRVGAQVEA
ncbi:flagellar motor stator protein MotA [Planomicrobium sp. CPCC 101079]|uniref:flagellar motor stator protein MotA n=1 Tax=Planomicrobium sp. CPCC 101079 TaxID=2599618 RepID=UPI0011B5A61D|nr:flagellar motor stator protein MotA [Planomicrobium sp. CPCC 101079]TWT03678.1 flagellar motor stator protein MotA [Planomicrobium sp. CPCC 101079]